MEAEREHACINQAVVEAIAETIAGKIRGLPKPAWMSSPVAQPAELPATLTVPQAAKVIGISKGMAYEAVRAEQIPSLRIGGRILVPTGRLFEFLATGKPWRERKAELLVTLAEP